jgi:SAM-dependent methyltransferase
MTLAAPVLIGQEGNSGMFADALAYQRFMGRWSSMLAPLLVDFSGLPDSGRILDVGSGTGALTFSIAERRPHCRLVGIDPSKEYVDYANSKNPFRDRVQFQVGDAQRLKFSDAAFGNSLSLLVFNFIPGPAKALSEVRRVTQPGGWISAAVWDYGAGMKMLRAFWDAAAAVDPSAGKRDERNMPLCHAGELSNLWKQGGLAKIEERPLEIPLRFESFADFWDPFLLGQGPAGSYVSSLSDDRRKALRNELQRQLAIRVEGAPFSLPARAWAVRGMV